MQSSHGQLSRGVNTLLWVDEISQLRASQKFCVGLWDATAAKEKLWMRIWHVVSDALSNKVFGTHCHVRVNDQKVCSKTPQRTIYSKYFAWQLTSGSKVHFTSSFTEFALQQLHLKDPPSTHKSVFTPLLSWPWEDCKMSCARLFGNWREILFCRK